ncbi:cupredoxin domain-containing protein [Candidatus Nitrospira salsa]
MVQQRKLLTTLLGLGILFLIYGMGFGQMHSTPVSIHMESWAPYYRPFEATIQSGTPIHWNNPTASSHTVRHDGCDKEGPCLFDSGAVPPNGSFSVQGLAPGRYPYHCELHPIMRGQLVIAGPVESKVGSAQMLN